MATRDGQYGGDGNLNIPYRGAAEISSAETPIARDGPPKSFLTPGERDYLNTGVMPQPARGVMFRVCCECGAALESEPVDLADGANGGMSHGYCPPCQARFEDQVSNYLNELDEVEAEVGTDEPDPDTQDLDDIAEDAHAIAHSMGERFDSAGATALLRGLGLEIEAGGVA